MLTTNPVEKFGQVTLKQVYCGIVGGTINDSGRSVVNRMRNTGPDMTRRLGRSGVDNFSIQERAMMMLRSVALHHAMMTL